MSCFLIYLPLWLVSKLLNCFFHSDLYMLCTRNSAIYKNVCNDLEIVNLDFAYMNEVCVYVAQCPLSIQIQRCTFAYLHSSVYFTTFYCLSTIVTCTFCIHLQWITRHLFKV